jgi:hypothetical protein
LHHGDDVRQQLTEGFALFGENLALSILQPPVRSMPSEKRAVNTVFFQDELQFLAQGLIDLSSDTSQQLFPRHGERLTAQMP